MAPHDCKQMKALHLAGKTLPLIYFYSFFLPHLQTNYGYMTDNKMHHTPLSFLYFMLYLTCAIKNL